MNLKDFVSETLTQIIEGVKDAQEKARKYNGRVNPDIWRTPDNLSKENIVETSDGKLVQIIDFNIALTVLKEDDNKTGVGIFVGGLGIGTQNHSNSENGSVSNVKFKVPITLPEDTKAEQK